METLGGVGSETAMLKTGVNFGALMMARLSRRVRCIVKLNHDFNAHSSLFNSIHDSVSVGSYQGPSVFRLRCPSGVIKTPRSFVSEPMCFAPRSNIGSILILLPASGVFHGERVSADIIHCQTRTVGDRPRI